MRRLSILLLTTLAVVSPSLPAADLDFMRAWESAQKGRPAALRAIGTIAPPSEPGTPLTIRGQVVSPEGRAVPDAIVFAWQTDADGAYDRRGTPAHSWRLRGWVRTDRQGSFTFHTIRPGAYPNHREPAHVHFSIETAEGKRSFARDLQFSDDPRVKGTRHEANAVKVTERNGRQEVTIVLRVDPGQRF